jgi:hypothetical protein
VSPDELRERQSNRHKGADWLRARGLRAGRASAKARLRRIALRMVCLKGRDAKARAFILGYERGYRAAYKRHFEYWRKRHAA